MPRPITDAAAGKEFFLGFAGVILAIVSVAGNKVYFPVGSQVICLEGKE